MAGAAAWVLAGEASAAPGEEPHIQPGSAVWDPAGTKVTHRRGTRPYL
jgi:hypothetical protein